MATASTHLQIATSPRKQKLNIATAVDRERTEHNFLPQSDFFPCFHILTLDESDFTLNTEIGTFPPWTGAEPLAFGAAAVGTTVSPSNESRPVDWSQIWQLNKSPSENQKICESAIQKLLETAGEKNWDGEDADPVSQSAVDAALEVAAMLSDSIETPEIAADPHGKVEFDWNLENGTMFTISVGHSREIAISGLNPEKARLRGLEENSEGDSVYLLLCGLNWLVEMSGK